MSDSLNRHRLEIDLPDLKHLDAIRNRAAKLRQNGVSALMELFEQPAAPNDGAVHRLTACRVAIENGQSDVVPILEKEIDLATADVLESKEQNKYGVLTVAQLIRASLTVQSRATSGQAFAAWYLLFREFYRTPHAEPSLGAARVNDDGSHSAYVTAECLDAMLELEGALSNTATLFESLAQLVDRLHEISAANVMREWAAVETSRLIAGARVTMAASAKRAVLVWPEFPDYLSDPVALQSKISEAIDVQFLAAENSLTKTIEEIKTRRIKDFPTTLWHRRAGDPQPTDEAEILLVRQKIQAESATAFGHSVGMEILERAQATIISAREKNSSFDWPLIALSIRELALVLHERLRPTQTYLSSVIDRQIAAKLTGQQKLWDPCELSYAAYGYCRFENLREQDKTRLQLAARYVGECIGADGHMHPRRPFHRNGATAWHTSLALGLSTWARFVELAGAQLTVQDADKLLPFFEDTHREDSSGRRTIGWVNEAAHPGAQVSLWSTALAVYALRSIESITTSAINQRIFPHFTVRYPIVPLLDELFYPDYGLAAISKDDSSGLRRESVGIDLQRMRAHICGVELKDRIVSLVLHGPAGTGKTTLAESLSTTCGVPMVEVTPSDISQAGTDGIEGRARVVFEALGLLSRVVILFDEFDPLLQRRSDDGRSERNIFMFLTPGMLPKLKLLHDHATARNSVYILNTNLIGTLDEAAVRQGRFDRKIGLYPPDVLSRLGRLQLLSSRVKSGLEARGESDVHSNDEQLGDSVVMTGGAGMTALARHGWYGLNSRKLLQLQGTPLGCIFGYGDAIQLEVPEPEDRISKIRGSGQAAEREYAQWKYVSEWDESVRGLRNNVVHDFYLNLVNNIVQRLQRKR